MDSSESSIFVCLYYPPSVPFFDMYLKYKETNQLFAGPLHNLVGYECSAIVQEKFVLKPQISLGSWDFSLELKVETKWLPIMSP